MPPSDPTDDIIVHYHGVFCHFIGIDEKKDRAGTELDPEKPPNKARQKLLKLSQTHFTELATDVHDELQRRISDSPDTPKYLLPKDETHPKRNQARQKLALLSTGRFNDLATDILYDLERRYPTLRPGNLWVGDADSNKSAVIQVNENSLEPLEVENNVSNTATPVDGTSNQSAASKYDAALNSQSSQTPIVVPQSLKPNTIIPTKSTLVEEEGDDDDEDTVQEQSVQPSEDDSDVQGLEEPVQPFEAPSPGLRESSGSDEEEPVDRRRSLFDPGMLTLDSIAEEEEMMSEVERNNRNANKSRGQITPPPSKFGAINTTIDEIDEPSIYGNDPADLQAQLKDRDEQIQMLVAEGSRMDDTINKLEKQLVNSEEFKNSLSQENEVLHARLAELEKQLEDLRAENRNFQQELEELMKNAVSPTAVEEQEKVVKDLQEQHENTQAELETHKSKAAELAESLSALEQEHQAVQEAHVTALSKQLETQETSDSLNRENKSLKTTISEHEETIAALQKQLEEFASNPPSVSNDFEQKYNVLLEDHSKLQNELENQQRITDQVRQEASAFLLEMRNLAESQRSNWEASENMSNQIQALKVEVQEWKSRYSRVKSQVRDLRSSTYGGSNLIASTIILEDNPYFDPRGRVKDTSVTKFQMAMDEFLQKSRDNKANLLEYLHNLVIATRVITQDINDVVEDDQTNLPQHTALVSSTANQLITTTRNHATSGGLSPLSILDAAASDLSFAVVELLKVAKILPTGQNGHQKEERQVSPSSVHQSGFLDNESVDTIGKYDNTIQVKKRRASLQQQVAKRETPALKDPVLNFDMEDPDNTVAELQAYLEEKTAGAVDGIQNLLTGIRDNATYGTLKPQILDITKSVDSMVEATGISMKQSKNWLLKDKGNYILDNLSDCSARLSNVYLEIKNLDDSSTPDRSLKQRLASLSFDMAKCTKELVKTVEEVSLHYEINHIDSRLAA